MKSDATQIFKTIYECESDAIFRFCLIRVSSRDQALDITQETFLRLWKSMIQKKVILNSRAFLFTIAHHLIIDWYRKKKVFPLKNTVYDEGEIEFDLSNDISTDNLELEAEGRYLLGKINELSPAHKKVVYLRFIKGLSPQEIGDILGISANNASVRVNRGIQELREKAGYDKNKKNIK